MPTIYLDPSSADSYRLFLRIKALPRYSLSGRLATIPEEYASALSLASPSAAVSGYAPSAYLFDYQRDISALAIRKRKFAVFAACGLGKTAIFLEFVRYCLSDMPDRRHLIVSPLMVIRQTIAECARFYGDTLPVEQVRAPNLQAWMDGTGHAVGITNYEAIREGLKPGKLGSLILDESSLLKSHYGRWGSRLIDLGKGLPYKLCLTGTPAPNDRIEFANHAVFLDQEPTVNAFLARYFVNRGQTQNRWELKAHALRPFYRSLSHWCIFLEHPSTYGWRDNCDAIPPIQTHIHDVPLTDEQKALVCQAGGDMFGTPSGIVSRAKLSQLAKGRFEGRDVPSNKPAFLCGLVNSWPDESTIIWARFNHEQAQVAKLFPGCANIAGDTPQHVREELIADFQAGRRRIMVTKPKILGFGLNLQVVTRQVFSTLQDSWEEFHQAVKRSNRIGSSRPLQVHIPITEVEREMVSNVLRKANRIQRDTEEQEKLFKEVGYVF